MLNKLLLVPAIIVTVSRLSFSQISVTPLSLYIHSPSNIASLQVSNYYHEPREISVSFDFGYLSSDEDGNQVMVYDDTVACCRYGLNDCLKAFPRKFLLSPGSSQTVRVQIRNVTGKRDGMYWNRIVISSNAVVECISNSFVLKGIGTKINYVLKHNIPVFYRKGNVTTGLELLKSATFVNNEKLKVLVSLARKGNSPFNGSVNARLIDSKHNEVACHQQTTVVYFKRIQKIEMDLPDGGLDGGDYYLELTYRTSRKDIPSYDLVQSDPVKIKIHMAVD